VGAPIAAQGKGSKGGSKMIISLFRNETAALPAVIARGLKAHGITRAAIALCFAAAAAVPAQQQPAVPQPNPSKSSTQETTHITPEQAKQLFALVDDLIKFSSQETGLPIKSTVKRQMTTRAEVEGYLNEKFNDDEGAKRLKKGEIVLKKFGMLDRGFDLKPFLLALLKEQIEAYYDSKTKTVNMLDWIGIDEQKPVLAHELTHALQDQHTDLEKWGDQTPNEVSHNSSEDTGHLAKDEMDTARQAVVEGQATAVMMDYMLKPMGKSLVKDPEIIDILKQQMSASGSSPVLARAPLLLSESLLFPYREGLSFEQDVWMDKGQAAAFTGTLDRPPTSTWEIENPREYERARVPAVPLLPDIHPLVDKLYKPYDIGQIGQLDLHILAELFGGEAADSDLTPAWDGGIYWAGQLRSATPAEQSSPKSLAIFYLSVWKNPDSAQAFAQLYANSLGRKYSGLKPDLDAPNTSTGLPSGSTEDVYSTSEGPVVITTRGKMVFVAESFDLALARKLTALVLDAQGSGEMKMAGATPGAPGLRLVSGARVGDAGPRLVGQGFSPDIQRAQSNAALAPEAGSRGLASETLEPLTANLIRFFSNCGVMKAAVQAGIRIAVSVSHP
jgi:hypothetical protein